MHKSVSFSFLLISVSFLAGLGFAGNQLHFRFEIMSPEQIVCHEMFEGTQSSEYIVAHRLHEDIRVFEDGSWSDVTVITRSHRAPLMVIMPDSDFAHSNTIDWDHPDLVLDETGKMPQQSRHDH